MVDIKTTSIPAKPRSKNYPAGAVITRTTGGVTVNGGGGGGASVDIVKATDTKSFTDSNVLSSLRTLLEIRSRIIAESDTVTELTDDNVLSSKRTLKEIDAAIKEALKKLDDIYLSKVKADTAAETITFLKGLLIGNDLAFINESGDAELQSLVARMKVKAATLEVTGSANVGTLHSEGNISTGADIWAKGDTHTLNLLVQALAKTYDLNVEHVATLFQTIVKDFISSERFIPGLMGEGMKLYKAINGDWNLEIDNAVVRKAMTIFELIISKVRAVNGGLVISSANGRVKSVSETSGDPAYYVLGIEGDMMFVADDLVRCQVYTSGHVKYYWVPVASVNDDSILILKSVLPNGTVPAVGDDLVQMGNLTNPNRQGILYLTASEDGKPRISVLDGVNSTSLAGKNKVILGCLDGMTDTDFPADLQPSGYGLYAMNCFLKGIFILRNGKSIEQEFSNIATELAAIPGKIELAIRSMKVADVNLLYDSNHKLNANPYQMGAYKYDVHLEVGKTYTLTVCYKCADSDVIRAYNNPSYGWIGSLPKSAEETVLSQPITPINPDGAYFYFYKFPQQESTGTYIKWAVITEGSVGVANWIPSATERKLNIGGENLILKSNGFNTGHNVEYTYHISKPWLDLTGKTLTLSFDYEYSNLKLNSETRIGLEKAILKNGTTQYYYIGAWKYFDSTSPKADKGRFTHTIKVPDDIELTFDDDIIAYIRLGYGSECKMGNVQMEIGDTPTGWKPAPDDTLIESKKYTDSQIRVIDGKIELSVKTQLETATVGGSNILDGSKEYWFNGSDSPSNVVLNYNPASNAWCNVKGKGYFNCYKTWMPIDKSRITAGKSYTLGIDVAISGNYFHTANLWFNLRRIAGGVTTMLVDKIVALPNVSGWRRYYLTMDIPDGLDLSDTFYLCGFSGDNPNTQPGLDISYKNINLVEGKIGTSWSPSQNDIYNKSVEYTASQIDIVEGKISLSVKTAVDNLNVGGNNLFSYSSSPLNVLYPSPTIERQTSIHGFYLVGSNGGASAMRIPNVIPAIPGKYTVSGWIKGSQNTPVGFTMDICDSASVRINTNATNTWKYFKHTFDVTKNTEEGSIYNFVDIEQISWAYIWVKDFKVEFGEVATAWSPNEQDPVFKSAEYTNSEIRAVKGEISATVSKVDSLTGRMNAAELKLTQTSASLSVVEGTANSAQNAANNAQGTANSAVGKADNAQGTANSALNTANGAQGGVNTINNGLVVTGINITSRKIVLKADNVLFQNNSGQQTAAINANGKLSANVIEAAEVVAQAFSAQRITTGNLTVTDGAYLGGWQIKNNAIYSRNVADAKIQLEISGTRFLRINQYGGAPTSGGFPLMEIRNDNQDCLSLSTYGQGGKALKIIANSEGGSAIQSHGSHLFGQRASEKWNAPGMLCTGYVYQAGTVTNEWGNGCTLTSAQKIATGKYRIYHSLKHPQYAVLVQGLGGYGWVFGQVETQNNSYFEVLMLDSNKGPRDCAFRVFVVGRNVW
jgi:hypothetical protein